ncbi:hypothetical protein [Hymenobacter sp. B1770]|uniref:hypothetical protein n=1 Tax=Hymenobacter sp. B1770 TaxID=1718788 RepID=UPI003CECA03F
MYSNLSKKLDSFYEQTNIEKEDTLKELLETINTAPEDFIKSFYNERFNYLNNLPIIYEALSKDLTNWADFFLDEIRRLFATAETVDFPRQVLTHLDELSFIDAEAFKHRDAFVAILSTHLENQHVTFRYYALSLIPDFVRNDDLQTINKIRKRLKDSDWRIRYWAFMALKDLSKLNSSDRLSVMDVLRSKIMSTISFN